MTVSAEKKLFKPPIPRALKETLQATYRLSRNELLAAVESAVTHIPQLPGRLKWEYEGFRRDRLFVGQSGDVQKGILPVTVEFEMRVEDTQVTLYTESNSEIERQLFHHLVGELNKIERQTP